MTKRRVVVVGGGFAGVQSTLDLSQHKYDLEITLIDKDGYHSYSSDYYTLISSVVLEKKHISPEPFRLLFSSVSIPLAEIFAGKENIELIVDEVTNVETDGRQVVTASGKKVTYDWLILALGSVTNFYNIPGLRQRAFELKTTADALNIRNTIDEIFSRKAKHETISIVIGGGGFTGCEVAGELAAYRDYLARIHGHPVGNVSIEIIEAAQTLLPGVDSWAQKKARRRLHRLGVKMVFSDPIIDVTDRTVNVKSGKTFLYDILMWTAGVRAHPLTEKIFGLELGKAGCIDVNKYLQVSMSPDIFAIGDVAFCRGFDEKPLPMTAQTAISQGHYVAYSIKRMLHHRKVFPYHPRRSKFIIPLGSQYALADLGWFKLEGFSAWVLKRLVALKYFLSILSIPKALKLWLRSVRL